MLKFSIPTVLCRSIKGPLLLQTLMFYRASWFFPSVFLCCHGSKKTITAVKTISFTMAVLQESFCKSIFNKYDRLKIETFKKLFEMHKKQSIMYCFDEPPNVQKGCFLCVLTLFSIYISSRDVILQIA